MREEESSDSTFHSDGSNRDESNDDFIFDKNINDLGNERQGSASNKRNSTVYYDSDEEKMVKIPLMKMRCITLSLMRILT